MRKYLLLGLVLLAGCTSTGAPRIGAIVGAIAGALLVSSIDDDDEPEPAHCTTVIRPSPGGGIGTNVTFC